MTNYNSRLLTQYPPYIQNNTKRQNTMQIIIKRILNACKSGRRHRFVRRRL